MTRRVPPLLWSIAALLFPAVVGCATFPSPNRLSGPTELTIVGAFSDRSGQLTGVARTTWDGSALVELVDSKSGDRCEGVSRVVYLPNGAECRGQEGVVRLSCSNDRIVDASWRLSACDSGIAAGFDQWGNQFSFALGRTFEAASAHLAGIKFNELPLAFTTRSAAATRKLLGYSTGTGFFVTSNGYLLTAFHVVEGSVLIRVHNAGGKTRIARVIDVDPQNDCALLKIDDVVTSSIPIRLPGGLSRGDDVMTLGYPLIYIQGTHQKATFGRVNALSGTLDATREVQIDVPIQPGNSGGPLLNEYGEAVGIVVSKLSPHSVEQTTVTPENVSYALKIESCSFVQKHRQRLTIASKSKGQRKAFSELAASLEATVVPLEVTGLN